MDPSAQQQQQMMDIYQMQQLMQSQQQFLMQQQGQGQAGEPDDRQMAQKSSLKNFMKFPTKKVNQLKGVFKFGSSDNGQQKEEFFQKKIYWMRDFNFKINYASNIFIHNPVQPNPNPLLEKLPSSQPVFKVYVGRGNNSQLIKRQFKQRWWWQIVDHSQLKEANFVWTQLKVNDFLKLFQSN